MTVTLTPGPLRGTAAAIPSKSQAHRLLLCAALSDAPCELVCSGTSKDIDATIGCLRAMGAEITRKGDTLHIAPIAAPAEICNLPCGESGSTLRFLLPVCGALGLRARFHMEGRLPQRPMGPLTEALTAHGMTIHQEGDILHCGGRLQPGDYFLPGNVSSQYITGLLFALPRLCSESHLHLTTRLESAAYVAMTLDALALCGVEIEATEDGWRIPGNQRPHVPAGCRVEGDWSNAAALLCAGAVAGPITVTGLRLGSTQGDRQVLDILRRFGATVEVPGDAVTVSPAPLRGVTIDAAEIPDLIPVLSAVAAAATGDTTVVNAGRLRLKESDRLAATAKLLRDLGGSVDELPEGLVIHGTGRLDGGTVDTAGDHRMAMTAAVCSLICEAPVVIPGAECVEKSYPTFWRDWESLRLCPPKAPLSKGAVSGADWGIPDEQNVCKRR